MDKNRIRLTESQLHRVIKESVKRTLNEIGNTAKGQYALGALAGRKHNAGVQKSTDTYPFYYDAAEDDIEALADKANGGKRSPHFDNGRYDFDADKSDVLRNLVNNDASIRMDWEGDDDDDIYYSSDYDDDDWMHEFPYEDFGKKGYDLKGAMKKRGLSESRLRKVIKESIKKVLFSQSKQHYRG